MARSVILLPLLFFYMAGCKKDKPSPVPSSSKLITLFSIRVADNPGMIASDVTGAIGKDTIRLNFAPGTDITHLAPLISISGMSVTPGDEDVQDFSSPVAYTITAEDGSTKRYIVVSRYLSSKKEITSFVCKAADNPALTADATGVIRNDTIVLTIPGGAGKLVPSVVYDGVSLSPAPGSVTDFSAALVTYTVTAEDGSTRAYKVFVSSGNLVYVYSRDGYVYALDAASGLLSWKTLVDPKIGGYYPPTLGGNGLLYVYGFPLTALNARTGAIVWQNHQATSGSIPVVQNNIVYSGMPDNSVYGSTYLGAFDAATGSLLWQQPILQITAFPLAAGNRVYAGSLGSGYLGFDAATGAPANGIMQGIVKSNPAYANDVVYAGGEWSSIGAFDAQSAALLWSYPTPQASQAAAPLVSGDTLFFSLADTLYELSTSRHTAIRKIKLPDGGLSQVALDNGILYGTSPAGYLYAISAATGDGLWRAGTYAPAGVAVSQPFAADGIVYAGNADQYFYAYDGATGAVRWKYPVNSYITMGGCVANSKGVIKSIALSGQQN